MINMHSYSMNGKEYPSVTTIIHILGNDRLMQWSNIMGFRRKRIDHILEESAEYGTYAHEIMRTIIDPDAPPVRPDIPPKHLLRLQSLKTKFLAFSRETNLTPKHTEFPMVSEKYRFGGTMDIFGSLQYQGTLYQDYILDFKTAKNVHSTMWLQMGGYYILCKEYGMRPKGSAIIRLNDDMIRFDHIDQIELKAYSKAFLDLRNFYEFWKDKK